MNAEESLKEVKTVIREIVTETFGDVPLTADETRFGAEPCGDGKEFYLWVVSFAPVENKSGAESMMQLSKSLASRDFEVLRTNSDFVAVFNQAWGNKARQLGIDISGSRDKPDIEIQGMSACASKAAEKQLP